jgi:hypothetical protein
MFAPKSETPSFMATSTHEAHRELDCIREITLVLERSTAAWNKGDLPDFIACYENSPDTVYLTSTRMVTGFAAIASMYSEEQPNAHNAFGRGALSALILRVTLLGREHALAFGRFTLERSPTQGGETNGVFSLVLRHTLVGWRIVADHTGW